MVMRLKGILSLIFKLDLFYSLLVLWLLNVSFNHALRKLAEPLISGSNEDFLTFI